MWMPNNVIKAYTERSRYYRMSKIVPCLGMHYVCAVSAYTKMSTNFFFIPVGLLALFGRVPNAVRTKIGNISNDHKGYILVGKRSLHGYMTIVIMCVRRYEPEKCMNMDGRTRWPFVVDAHRVFICYFRFYRKL